MYNLIVLFFVILQCGYGNIAIPNSFLAPSIAFIAVIISVMNVHFQRLGLMQNQLSEKAKECNKNIDAETQALKTEIQNLSSVVSIIITGELMVKSKFGLCWVRESLIDQFYLQLHTSIIEFLMANKMPENMKMDQGKAHVGFQLAHCNQLFHKSFKRHGNATPKDVQKKLDEWKKNNPTLVFRNN